MKKFLCLVLVLALSLAMVQAAFAESTVIQGEADRKISLNGKQSDGNFATNPVIAGQSPTTGREWDGYYMPMLVQIDNDLGGINDRAPWGVRYADIVYETPLHKNGATRISFLFSDYIPDSVGPVRSARLTHVWLREEWDAGFLYYGGQEAKGANINEEFRTLGANSKGVLFSGIVGANKPWKQYYTRVSGLKSPHNVDANVAAMQALIPADHVAPDRPYLFTDTLPTTGKAATYIKLGWQHKNYVCSFTYDADTNLYSRYVTDQPYVDKQTGEQVTFSNVIIQRVSTYTVAGAAIANTVGQGNAEIFMGGRYISGYWVRTAMDQRTIFFDENGNEIQLQRGATYIAMMESDWAVTYSAE